MRIHIQRVKQASVTVDGQEIGRIGKGLLLLVAAGKNDSDECLAKLAEKCLNLRIFGDEQGKMNLSVKEIGGSLLVISNFTLYADCQKGNRPNFMEAAPTVQAKSLYNRFVEILSASGIPVATGEFGAMMDVSLVNDGPVTILLEI